MRKRHGWLPVLALVIFGFLLGHDALMAADPHRPSSPDHTHAADIVSVSACPMPDGVRPIAPDVPLPDVMNAAFVIEPLLLPRLDTSPTGWGIWPDHPPDVRRALLQVFLN